MPDIERVLKSGSLAEIGALLRNRDISVHALTAWYAARIEKDNRAGRGVNAVRVLSGTALDEAARLDDELARGRWRGPLHGVPVLVKDNVLISGLPACAGAKALDGFMPPITATLATRLKAAGAVVLGKTNMTEFADYVSDKMPSEFSSAGGVVRNPFGLSYGRGQGSSVGSAAAVALSFAPIAIGSETQNSIQAPACHSGVVGFKPGVGRISRAGVIPLVPSQDAPGVLARSVEDAWTVYTAIGGPDPRDGASLQIAGTRWRPRPTRLSDLRIGAPRIGIAYRTEHASSPFDEAMAKLAAGGALIVNPCDIPSAERVRDLRSSVFRTEFKASLDAFLADYAPNGLASFDALVEWNAAHPDHIPYGQSLLIAALEARGLDNPEYRHDRRRDLILTRDAGLDAALRLHEVDLLAAPMDAAAKFTGKAGVPVMSIPIGLDSVGAPAGLSLIAPHGAEPALAAAARLVEAAVGRRCEP